MTLKYIAILAILPMLLTPAFGQYTLPLPEAEEDDRILPVPEYVEPEAEEDDRILPVPEYVEPEAEDEPKLKLHEEIDLSIFVEVVKLLQYLINTFNEVIASVNSNTSDIAELKQQIIQLQNP